MELRRLRALGCSRGREPVALVPSLGCTASCGVTSRDIRLIRAESDICKLVQLLLDERAFIGNGRDP